MTKIALEWVSLTEALLCIEKRGQIPRMVPCFAENIPCLVCSPFEIC